MGWKTNVMSAMRLWGVVFLHSKDNCSSERETNRQELNNQWWLSQVFIYKIYVRLSLDLKLQPLKRDVST